MQPKKEKRLPKSQLQKQWKQLTKWQQGKGGRSKTPCQLEFTKELLAKWRRQIQADRASRSIQNASARLKMRNVEVAAGVTHRELEDTSGRLQKAIIRQDFESATRISQQLAGMDFKLHEAAKAQGLDIAYLRTEVRDAKAQTYRPSA